jgi:putative RNA 2'-phosphotransferase
MDEGLKALNRNNVHLTDSIELARKIAKRHSSSIAIISINAKELHKQENKVNKNTENIYTCKRVPEDYLDCVEKLEI